MGGKRVILDSTSGSISLQKANSPFPDMYCYSTIHSIRFTNFIANPVLTKLITQFESKSKDSYLNKLSAYYTEDYT